MGLLLLCGMSQSVSAQSTDDVNVSVSNLSSNCWFDNYDDGTKMVNNLNFEILSEGNSSLDYVTPFTVKIYIWDGTNPTFVKTYNINSMHQMSALDYNNESVDLSSLGLPAGTYRLGVYCDADDAIPNPPDDGADNAFLLQGDINFTPGSSTASIAKNELEAMKMKLYPNPASDLLNLTFDEGTQVNNVTISNALGKIVLTQDVNPQAKACQLDVKTLNSGIYFVVVSTSAEKICQKIIIN